LTRKGPIAYTLGPAPRDNDPEGVRRQSEIEVAMTGVIRDERMRQHGTAIFSPGRP